MRYSIGGRTANWVNTVPMPFAQIWNPDTTDIIYVVEFNIVMTSNSGNMSLQLKRTLTRGATPSNTFLPDLDNAFGRGKSPTSTFVLEMGPFATAPTFQAVLLSALRFNNNNTANAETFPFPSEPIAIPPGTGLALICNTNASITGTDVFAIVDN